MMDLERLQTAAVDTVADVMYLFHSGGINFINEPPEPPVC